MRGRQFLDLAREIIAQGTQERHRRGAAGRAYYALLLECRDALDAWGFGRPRRDSVHNFVGERFLFNANADLQQIGKALERLKKLRGEADYELSGPAFHGLARIQVAIGDAAKALALLDAIMFDATRRSAAVADIKARWP
jgi:hypothetical protein